MLAPTHPFIAGWSSALLLLDLTYTAVLLPLAFGFRLNKEHGWLELSILVGLLFSLDMLVVLHRCGGCCATVRAMLNGPATCACRGRLECLRQLHNTRSRTFFSNVLPGLCPCLARRAVGVPASR